MLYYRTNNHTHIGTAIILNEIRRKGSWVINED